MAVEKKILPFYDFYVKQLGFLDEKIFSLFWSKKFQDCFNLLTQLSNTLGSPLSLGFNNLLIYNHCNFILSGESIIDKTLPQPLNKNELKSIYEYQLSQEMHLSNKSTANSLTSNILTQPKVMSKAILAAQIGIDYGCCNAIETGTFLGSSTYLFSGIFDSVWSIEADKDLYESSSYWLSKANKGIHCMNGDSGLLLKEVLESQDQKLLIFLDAHWSTGVTSNKYGICPLLNELKIILASRKSSIIVIDDIRCMGDEGYPNLDQILLLIPEGRNIQIKYDQMIII